MAFTVNIGTVDTPDLRPTSTETHDYKLMLSPETVP
jgi:hypothetical protein